MKPILRIALVLLFVTSAGSRADEPFPEVNGNVTAVFGNGVKADVFFYRFLGGTDWEFVSNVASDDSGNYTYTSEFFEPGTYRVEFLTKSTSDFVRQFYDGQSQFGNATSFTVNASQTVPGINAVMQWTRIKGIVSDSSDVPLRDIVVEAFAFENDAWESVGVAETTDQGKYTLGGFLPGVANVRLEFRDPSGNYSTEVYNNVVELDDGTNVQADAPVAVEINVSLANQTPPPEPAPPKIISVEPLGGNSFQLLFTGVPGSTYQIERSINLTLPWENYGAAFQAEPGINLLGVIQEGNKTFWRVKEVP